MSETTGYTSLSIKTDTAAQIREHRQNRGVTTDELLKSLLNDAEGS
jgi:hypothetical protein